MGDILCIADIIQQDPPAISEQFVRKTGFITSIGSVRIYTDRMRGHRLIAGRQELPTGIPQRPEKVQLCLPDFFD